ncbi:hypothetical protein ACQ4PT_041772 [Festuca glaucescens]
MADETGVHKEVAEEEQMKQAPIIEEHVEVPTADVEEAEPGKEVLKIKNQSNLFNQSSPMKLVRVFKDMTEEQKNLLIQSDFGGMIQMKCSKLIPELCRFLMGCFDLVNCVLDFGERGKIPITSESVVMVLGVPNGSSVVPYRLDVDATSLILNMLGITDGVQPNVSDLEKELGPSYPIDDSYLRKFIIYMISSVFAPTTGIKTAKAKDKKIWFKACMPYLMIMYVDSLETNAVNLPDDLPRCAIWTNNLISLVTDLDRKTDGYFGALPLKAHFRGNSSMFTTDPSVVDMFIRRHLHGSHTDEASFDLIIVFHICTLFEDGLATFIQTLEVQGPSSKQIEEEVVEHVEKAKPKRTRKAHVPIEKTCQAEKQLQDVDSLPVPNVKEDTIRKRKSVHTMPAVLEETVIEEVVNEQESNMVMPYKKICYVDWHSDNNLSHGPVEETSAWRNEEAHGTTEIAATATNASAYSDETPDALTKLQLS